jgi:ubiquinone/menaquinone biosynthesis C-methylase UbiE
MSNTHWTAYWETGALTSLPMDFKANYDGELEHYWQSILLKKWPEPVTVLDVCTGNGAIALLIQELAEKHQVKIGITAIDASDIDPTNISKSFPEKQKYISSINFIGNCLVENMAETINEQFDLVVSQYGIEYCDTHQAAKNVAQLLKPDGQLVFVAHSPDTAMHQYMQTEELMYQFLEQIGILDAFSRFGQNQLTVNGYKNKLQKSLDAMSKQIKYRSNNLFQTWGNAALQLYEMNNSVLKTQRNSVNEFYLKYQHARSRSQDMLNVTEKLLHQGDWFLTFEQYGLKLVKHDEIIYKNTHNVGHFYEFIKLS